MGAADAFWSIRRRIPNSFFTNAHLSELLPQQPPNLPLRGKKTCLFQVFSESASDLAYPLLLGISICWKGDWEEETESLRKLLKEMTWLRFTGCGVWDRHDSWFSRGQATKALPSRFPALSV